MKQIRKIPTILWVLLYFSIMTVVMTYPLLLKMGHSVVGETGDNIYFIWMIGWFKKALFDLHVNPFNVWFLNYPEGWNMAYTEITPAQLLLALPFSMLGTPTFAYNSVMMLTFILSGFGMYLWVHQLTGRIDAALIAGTAFAFIPYRFAHFLIGHLNLTGTQWLPFYFLGLLQLLKFRSDQSQKTNWKFIIITGISLGLIAMTSQYYLYMTLLVSGFMILLTVLIMEKRLLRDKNFWKQMLLTGLVALPLVAIAVAPYVLLTSQGGLPDRSVSLVRQYSASLSDFLLPSTDHFLWGRWVGQHFNREMWIEGTLYIGTVTAALAIIAWINRQFHKQHNLLRLLFWTGLFALILAMGTDLHWNGAPIEVIAPAFLAEKLQRTTIPIILPGYFLLKYFPLYGKLRAMMRFGVFVLVFVCVAAGIGSAWLITRVKQQHRHLISLLLVGLIFLDFYPGAYQQFFEVKPRPVDHWLAMQPGEGAVVQMPFSQAEDQEHTYYTLIHGKPYIGGFFNAFPPAQYQRIRPVLENFPDQKSVDSLHELGVVYVLADADEYADLNKLRHECQYYGLQFVGKIGEQLVFRF